MRRVALLPLLLLTLPADARRDRTSQPIVQKVPSIAEVVAKEGFIPTLSQSETYRPGVVLVPNAQGGHDEVIGDCIAVEPNVKIMSQSSIATSLSAGVSARLSAVRGELAAGVEKRLSFVDPEQRTIPLAKLNATEACAAGLENAARFTDLSQAILVYDVLVAQIQNTVCTRADASGSVTLLGEAEAAAYSECVQESDAQVPLGFKSVALSQVLAVAVAGPPPPPPVVPGQPASASASVDFGTSGGLGIDAQLKEQACEDGARAKGAAARASRLSDAERDAKAKASAAWRSLSGDLEKCTQLKQSQRARCVEAAEQWLSQARAMPVSIRAGVEPIETACGLKQPAFAADSRVVTAEEVSAAEAMLMRLDGVAGSPPPPPVAPGQPASASASVDFGTSGGLGIDAQLKEQACEDGARAKGAAARASRLSNGEREAKAKASAAWRSLSDDLEKCTQLKQAQRARCVAAAQQWLSQARAMQVSLPAGVEPIETACGLKQPAFAANSRTVMAEEVATAEAMLGRLEAPDGAAPGKAGVEWVRITGGTFPMGSNSGQKSERPVHTVRVSDFELMKTEVTFGHYNQCVAAGACTSAHTSDGSCYVLDGSSWKKGNLPSSFQGDDQPAVCVDWNQVQAFAKWAGGRLPTEAEWEYAARSGGKSWAYPWGNQKPTCSWAIMDDGGDGCGRSRTSPVCSRPAGNSTHGVCDLAGNVWEWTQDSWHDFYSGAPGEGTAWEGGASDRVSRGGGWYNIASYMRASYRLKSDTSARFSALGFRLAR